jgi:hypothetical protein
MIKRLENAVRQLAEKVARKENRNIYYIDVSKMPPKKALEHLEKFKKKHKE